jgi:hypothetical protein
LDDRVAGGLEVLGGVAARRAVAAADVAACQAEPQVDPVASGRETFLASRRAWSVRRRGYVGTDRRHLRLRCDLTLER